MLMAGVLLVFYLDGFVLGAPVALLLVWALLGVVVLVGFLRHAGHGRPRVAGHRPGWGGRWRS